MKRIGETKFKKELLTLLRLIFRDALFLKTALKNPQKKSLSKREEGYLLLKPELQRTQAVAQKYTTHALLYAQQQLTEAEKQLKFNTNFSQCIEICIASILEENK